MKRLSNRNDATVQTGTASDAFQRSAARLKRGEIMNKENNGGPAFPQSGVCTPETEFKDSRDFGGGGLSMRDYMAAKALQGWLASYPDDNRHPVIAGNADEVAMNAYQMADAMLRAREAS